MTLPFTMAEHVIALGAIVSILDRYVDRPDDPTAAGRQPMQTKTDDGSTYLRRMTAAGLTVTSTLVTLVAYLMLTGTSIACNDASSHRRGSIAIRYPDGSEFRSSDDNSATAHGPASATQPVTTEVGQTSASASSSGAAGELPKTLTDYAGRGLWLFYAGAIASVFGAVFAFRKAHAFEAVTFLIAAGTLAVTPTFLAGMENIVAPLAIGLAVVAVVLLVGRKLGAVREKAAQGYATVQTALRQAAAGEPENALGTLESHPDIVPIVAKAKNNSETARTFSVR